MNDYELKHIPDKKIINDIVDFSEIKENNLLSIPIISVDSQSEEIFCSYNEININMDPFYPSLLSEPFKIYIMTISNLTMLIDMKEKKQNIIKNYHVIDSADNLVRIDNEIKNNRSIEISVKPPKVKDIFLEKEVHWLKFYLEISCKNNDEKKQNYNKKPFRLPINIKMNLMPIIIKIISNNKKLEIENNNFIINSNLYKGEEIKFSLQQVQNNVRVKLKPLIQIEGVKNNNSRKPLISFTNEEENSNFCIIIPKNDNNKKYNMKANINLFYTEKVKFSIKINSELLDFDYQLNLFDYESKKFKNENLIIKYNYLEKLENKKIIKLLLKFNFPNGLRDGYNGEIFFENQNEDFIKIINIDEIKQLNFIKNNSIIQLNIDMNKNIFNNEKEPKIIIKSEINDIYKEAKIIFVNEENELDLFEEQELKENKEDDKKEIYYFIEEKGIISESTYNKKIIKNMNHIEVDVIEKEKEFNNIKIELPELIKPNNPMSLQDMENFYSLCIKIIRTLPSYIQYSLKIESKENLMTAQNLFSEIFGYYKLYPLNQKNNSFLHEKINTFLRSYKDLAKRLYKSGLKLKKSNLQDLFGINEYELLDNNIQTEYITQPKEIELNIPEIINEDFFILNLKDSIDEFSLFNKSNININLKNYFTEGDNKNRNPRNLRYEMGNFLSTKDNGVTSFRESNNFNLKNLFNDEKEEEEEKEDKEEKEEFKTNYPFEDMQNYKKIINADALEKINLGNKEYIKKLKEEEKEENQPNNNIINANNIVQKNMGYVINEDVTKTIQIMQENFENYTLTEKNGIQWILKKLEKLDYNTELNLTNTKGYLPKYRFMEKNKKNFQYKILELSSHILKLSNIAFNETSKLIAPDTKLDIPFSKMCVILLIDGSCYISLKRKILNFFILCSYAIVCNLLEIPYGIAVVADGKFKIILKQFEEPHSFDILEKVYECLMIRRFRDNLSNSQVFAKETFMFSLDYNSKLKNNEIPNFYKEHKKKVIITITDGLDEELKLTSKWNHLIFNESEISFGFIFNKPDFANAEDKKKIEKLWENFIEESKKAKSKVIIYIYDKSEEKNLYQNLSVFFRDLICQKQENFDENIIKEILNPDFLDGDISLNSIETLKEIFKNFKRKNNDNQLYIQNYPLQSFSNGIFNEGANLIDKNKLGQICKAKVDKNIEKEYKELIDNFIIKYNEIDKMSLEKIFKKNKGSQKVLSTTGSEIDIISLVISILNKEPRPKIFWEELGEMKRQYSVSIIIDNSISCFADISREHSFRIIRELLSALSYLDISKLDIILTTNNSPLILCSDVDSQNCLKNDSSLWIGLFKYLQEPYYGCDLSSALNFAYNINRERNEYSKRIFVLTDGLYERKEQLYIKRQIQNCTQLDMNIIGIGIGSYPIGIENIFEKIIYTIEPSNLLLGLSGFFEQIYVSTNEKMIGFEQEDNNKKDINDIIKNLVSNKKIHFTKLNEELKKIEVNYTTFEYFNKPVILDKHFTNLNEAKNPEENENTLMLEKNFLLGKKILIVMLWSYDLNKSYDNEKIIPGNLFRSKKMNVYTENIDKIKSEPCVESAVDIYGLKIYVVLDYENAIKELTKNINGKCDYNSVWIMCGPQKAILPNPKSDPNLIGEFMKVIDIFWKNGGSLVFFADGDPLFYQVNLFLENAEFPLDEEDEDDENNQSNELNNILNRNEYDNDNDSHKDTMTNFLSTERNEILFTEENEKDDEKNSDEENRNIEEEEEEEEEMNLNEIIIEEKEARNKNHRIKDKILTANFRILGSHKGEKTLLCDRSGLLEDNQRFNGANIISENLKRPNIGANLLKIYEGVTISYAQEKEDALFSIFAKLGLARKSVKERYSDYLKKKNNNPIYPFIPFARDSDGGISIMIYYGKGCGDIVIDCGFTKCFIEMKEEGTFRYIRNLSAVTSRCDVLTKEGEDPQTWRPDFIDYKLEKKNYFWPYFQRKIYIIEADKPLSKDSKSYIYEQILNELYSEYNNIIYFYSNGVHKIKLEDIMKENSLIPELNTQNNLAQIAKNLLKECNDKFGNYYTLEIFSDGYCSDRDNKFIDFVLSCEEINMNMCQYQLLPGIEVNITADFTQLALSQLDGIKSLEEFNNKYKDIRNCLIFLPYQYSINISIMDIKKELDRISDDIIEKIEVQELKDEASKKLKILKFYAASEIEDFEFNTAAYKGIK